MTDLNVDQDDIKRIQAELRQRIDRMNRMAEALRYSDPVTAIGLCKQAVTLATPDDQTGKPYLPGLAASYFLLGCLLAERSDYHQATIFLLQASAIYEENGTDQEIARTLNQIGLNYSYLGAYPESLQHLLKALDMFRKHADIAYEAAVLNNLGQLSLFLDDPLKAINYLDKGLELARRTTHARLQAELLNRLSKAYCAQQDYSRAIEYGLKSTELYQRTKDFQGEIEALNSSGDAYLACMDYGRALSFFNLAATSAERFNKPTELARALRKIGTVNLRLGQYPDAITQGQRALGIVEKTGDRKQSYETFEMLSQTYKQMGDYQKALEAYEQFYNLKQALFNEQADTRLKTLEIVHQLENARKDAEIARIRYGDLQKEIEERKKAEAALHEMASADPLTSLFNRRHFFTLAGQEMERAHRYHRPLSLVMMDLDNFKQINDQRGHIVGDQVLMAVAEHIRAVIRKVDFACRYGGDEFVILLPETDLQNASIAAERLRERIVRHPATTDRGRVVVTITIGVASTNDNHTTVEQLLDQADRALYQAKERGRNQVMVSSQGEKTGPVSLP